MQSSGKELILWVRVRVFLFILHNHPAFLTCNIIQKYNKVLNLNFYWNKSILYIVYTWESLSKSGLNYRSIFWWYPNLSRWDTLNIFIFVPQCMCGIQSSVLSVYDATNDTYLWLSCTSKIFHKYPKLQNTREWNSVVLTFGNM